MKKIIALLIFVYAGAALFAQTVSLSVGGGAQFTADFTSVTLNQEYKDTFNDSKVPNLNSHLVGFGIYGFFDATYIEANLGLLFGNANADDQSNSTTEFKKGIDVTALKIGIFGKYPFELSGFTVFPMLGLDIMLPLGGMMFGETIPSGDPRTNFDKMFTQVWVKFGVGADFSITDSIFIRPEFLYGIRFNTDEETKSIGTWASGKSYSGILGHGLDIRVAVGYRF
jgi:hypothetical protein